MIARTCQSSPFPKNATLRRTLALRVSHTLVHLILATVGLVPNGVDLMFSSESMGGAGAS